jgi:hypothetical protein
MLFTQVLRDEEGCSRVGACARSAGARAYIIADRLAIKHPA